MRPGLNALRGARHGCPVPAGLRVSVALDLGDKHPDGSFTPATAFCMLRRAVIMTAKEHLHMGDKGGKKDKAKSKQQHDAKQKAEVKRNEDKSPRKTS